MGKKDNYVYGTDRTRYWCSILEHQRKMCRGVAIPKSSILEFGKHPGFFFGMKSESALQSGEYIGKPIKRDSHVLVAGESGRGKTQCIVLPTMATWMGDQIILDVKGDLHDYWKQLNKNTGNASMILMHLCDMAEKKILPEMQEIWRWLSSRYLHPSMTRYGFSAPRIF